MCGKENFTLLTVKERQKWRGWPSRTFWSIYSSQSKFTVDLFCFGRCQVASLWNTGGRRNQSQAFWHCFHWAFSLPLWGNASVFAFCFPIFFPSLYSWCVATWPLSSLLILTWNLIFFSVAQSPRNQPLPMASPMSCRVLLHNKWKKAEWESPSLALPFELWDIFSS